MEMGWIEIVSIVLNVVLGGGLIGTVINARSIRKQAKADAQKAEAEAKLSEINNVDAVAKMWRELAEKIASEHSTLSGQVEELHTEVRRLKNATNRVARLLDRITPENMTEMVEAIKKEIEDEPDNIVAVAKHNRPDWVQNDTAPSGSSSDN